MITINFLYQDQLDIFTTSINSIKENCVIRNASKILDSTDYFHDISGLSFFKDYQVAISDLGAIYLINHNLSNITILKEPGLEKIDYEEIQYFKDNTFFISREDTNSFEIWSIKKNRADIIGTVVVPSVWSYNLPFNKGIEAFFIKENYLFLFPEFATGSSGEREICKFNIEDSTFEVLYYYTDPRARITSVSLLEEKIYISEVWFDYSLFKYSFWIKSLAMSDLEKSKILCYPSDIISYFTFPGFSEQTGYIGNFESLYVSKVHEEISIFALSDDNHGIYHEYTYLLVIECNQSNEYV